MITNKICESCQSFDVCKIADIIYKFDEDAKKPIPVNLTLNSCGYFIPIDEEDSTNDRDE